MNFSKKQRVIEFNKKSADVNRALSNLLSRIESINVKPWSFGLDENGDFCGIIKTDGIDEGTMKRLVETSKNGFSIYLATNNNCYKIADGQVLDVDNYSGRDYINKQITKFRMSLVSL